MNSPKIAVQRQTLASTLALLVAAIVTLPVFDGLSATPSSSPDKELGVEVLSISVCKFARNEFGHPVNPFTGLSLYQGEAGTVVLAKITPRWSPSLKLQAQKCRLLSFKDDLGTVLCTNDAAELGDRFFPDNRPLEVLTAREGGFFGLKLRSARVPAPAANRLTAEVLLVFSRIGEELVAEKTGVLLQTNDAVTVGPVKVRFKPRRPDPDERTNQMVGGFPSAYWLASFSVEKETAIASVVFSSEKSDEPILIVKNLSTQGGAAHASTGLYDHRSNPGRSGDGSSATTGYGFAPPEDRKMAIKVRYYAVGSLVEKHCVISTGLSP